MTEGNLSFIDKENIVESSGEFEPLPEGKYIAMITGSELRNTKSGTGKMLCLTWTIFQEPYAGRLVFDYLNIKNDSEKAQQIALGNLKRIALTLGLKDIPDDSTELHDKALILKLDIDEGGNGYKPKNVIKGYLSKDTPIVNRSVPAAKFDDDDVSF